MLENAGLDTSFRYLLKGKFKDYAEKPFYDLPEEIRRHALYGVPLGNQHGNRQSHNLFEKLQWRLLKGKEVGNCISMHPCPECQGFRVGPEARRVTLNQKHIGELGQMSIGNINTFLEDLPDQTPLSPYGHSLLKEILRQIRHFFHVGLGHLSLYREMPTLSGGELQRLFLMSHLDSEMDSLIYVLDEPTIGLHELEKANLLQQLRALHALGNSVIIVEHDKNTIEQADYVLDIGPRAGVHGGEIVYQGDYAGLLGSEQSITAQYLSGRRKMPEKALEDYAVVTEETPTLSVSHANIHNLQDLTIDIPLGMLVGVAGVSGSGKSSLIADTLAPLLEAYFARSIATHSETDASLRGAENLAGYAEVSQGPIGRRRNSHPVSYLGVWDKIRKLFAQQPLAKQRGYAPGHFSFNSKGACPECLGSGEKKLWLGGHFFVSQHCPQCHGNRYRQDILNVLYQGKTVNDVLNMSISEAAEFFHDIAAIHKMLRLVERFGMGYVLLGQPAPTLSGGESQRIKLAKELGKRRKGKILYVLDEPTTGLSFYDIDTLVLLLDELLAKGHSIILIEHDPSILSYCDWIIELGPGGGDEGGQVLAQGSPIQLKNTVNSKIGPFLLNS